MKASVAKNVVNRKKLMAIHIILPIKVKMLIQNASMDAYTPRKMIKMKKNIVLGREPTAQNV